MHKILVVDDVRDMRELLRIVLVNKGFEVHTAENAKSFFQQLGQNHFDLILLDINLPDITGIEALNKIKKIYQGDLPKVIFVSGETDPKVIKKALASGATEYICKPIDTSVLMDKVYTSLGIEAEEQFATIRCELPLTYVRLPLTTEDHIIELSEVKCKIKSSLPFAGQGVFEIKVPYLDDLFHEPTILKVKIRSVEASGPFCIVSGQFFGLSERCRDTIRKVVIKGDAVSAHKKAG